MAADEPLFPCLCQSLTIEVATSCMDSINLALVT